MPTHGQNSAKRRRYALPVLAIGLLIVIGTGRASGTRGLTSGITLVGYGSSEPNGQPPPGAASAPGGGPQTMTFSISGKVVGLYPGNTRTLALKVTNPNTVAITVTSITTTVSNASSVCVAANVKVTSFTGSLSVAAGKSVTVNVKATMLHSAPNPCQGAVLPFHYTGIASGA
jgi:hypothetical protein